MSNHTTIRPGSSLENTQAHQQEHQDWGRRDFLRLLGLTGAGSVLIGNLPVSALSASPLAYLLNNANDDRILVMIRLKGGNDGQNTIIPIYDYGRYQTLRPRIAIPRTDIISLNTEMGIPKTMAPLENLWKNGNMRVVHNVGYPSQNLSHFRSSDIWASASDANTIDSSGWLGRWLDNLYPDYFTKPPVAPPALQIGSNGTLAFNDKKNNTLSVAVTNPEELERIAKEGRLYNPLDVPDCLPGEQLTFLRGVANSTFQYAGIIADAYKKGVNTATYASGSLNQQLALVARLIKGGLPTRLYMVTLEGFDTHANQNQYHPGLMQEIATSVANFITDLSVGKWDERVLTMTISEFGRRIEQNASNGTDHGAAAPLMLFGMGLNGSGFVGKTPSLTNLDEVGNLKFETDFRQIYTTILESWLCINSSLVDKVMGKTFARIPELGLQCSAVTAVEEDAIAIGKLPMKVYPLDGQLQIQFDLPESGTTSVQLLNLLGQTVSEQSFGQLPAGKQQIALPLAGRLPTGPYVVALRAGRYLGSEKVMLSLR
jgi:uncharacterized protein (DUF1501 family)